MPAPARSCRQRCRSMSSGRCEMRCSLPMVVSLCGRCCLPRRGRRCRAPHLRPRPRELARAVDMLLWDAEAVPLVGVVGACERVYAPAAVIAVEAAIAGNEAELGAPLTGGQAPAVRAITHIRAAHG